jgi:hypothetical protein
MISGKILSYGVRAYEEESAGRAASLRDILSLLPSKWIEPVGMLFILRPQIKNKASVLIHLALWIGDGTDETEQLTLQDFGQMLTQLASPKYVSKHNYGEAYGQIMADLATMFEERRSERRRLAEMMRRREEDANGQAMAIANQEGIRKLASSLAGSFAEKRGVAPPRS